jgi:hypothetical protein
VPELYVNRIGRTLVPANAEAEDLIKKIPERRFLKAKVNVPRNQKVHELFFSVVSDALEHWPHGHDPKPEGDAERLRAWLLCRARHCTFNDYPLTGNPLVDDVTAKSVAAEMERGRQRGEYPFLRDAWIILDGEKVPTLRIYYAKSIAHDVCDEVAFRPIKEAVFEIVENVTGIGVQVFIDMFHQRKAQEAQQRAA